MGFSKNYYKTNQNHMNEATIKPTTFFRFEDLRIYHKALDYVSWVHTITLQFPNGAQCCLAKGFNEAARQIALQIAEGSSREKANFICHLKEAKSAIRSCLVYASIAHRNNYLSEHEEDESRSHLMEMTKMLGALITSLQKNISGNQEQFEEDFSSLKSW